MKNRKSFQRRLPRENRCSCIHRELEFSVTAKDDVGEEKIKQKAKRYRLRIYKKGHARNRIYVKCSEKKWLHFYKDIKDACTHDGAGRCPAKLQRAMWKNLCRTSYNRINPVRAGIARYLLETIESEADNSGTITSTEINKAGSPGNVEVVISPTVSAVSSGGGKSVRKFLSKCLSGLRQCVSRKKHLKPAHI
jgi:hypothetical protein